MKLKKKMLYTGCPRNNAIDKVNLDMKLRSKVN